jgi:predicted small lipoprotein YifL
MKTRIAILALSALVVIALAGCGSASPGPGPDDPGTGPSSPDEPASISGVIVMLTPGAGGGTLLIESDAPAPGQYDAASVRVSEETVLLAREADGTYALIGFDRLAVGLSVEAWFVGPVAESYPVQATAGTLVVLR